MEVVREREGRGEGDESELGMSLDDKISMLLFWMDRS